MYPPWPKRRARKQQWPGVHFVSITVMRGAKPSDFENTRQVIDPKEPGQPRFGHFDKRFPFRHMNDLGQSIPNRRREGNQS